MNLHFSSNRMNTERRDSRQFPALIRELLGLPGRLLAGYKGSANNTDPLGEGELEAPEKASMASRCLIVGLGNPGRKHRNNRHNAGFMAVERLASKHGIVLDRVRNKAIFGLGRIAGRPVILAKPQTFMNLSGESVGPLARYYRIAPQNVLIIYDELDLPLGVIRLRAMGGAGGHNGMKSLISHLGQEFPRMRLGIGRPPGQMPPAAYLLQDFGADELLLLTESISAAEKAVVTFLESGIELAMSRHNGPVEQQS